MLDTIIVAVVLCVDTCGYRSVQNRIDAAIREINIRRKVTEAISEQREQDMEKRKAYWHLKRTYIMRPKDLKATEL